MAMDMFNKNTVGSDDEDDLEFLRLAALKSLKQKSTISVHNKHSEGIPVKAQHSYKPTFGAAQTTRHHNRGFRNNLGRSRNGMCSRARTNTNLISIQTIDQSATKEIGDIVSAEVPKLVLPQDRYHKPQMPSNSPKETASNKFDRYDNSDESESDSEELMSNPVRRKRKGSLELLMDALENEINVLDGKADTKAEESEALHSDDRNNLHETGNPKKHVVDVKNYGKSDQMVKASEDTLIISDNCPDLVLTETICLPKDEVSHNEKLLSSVLKPVYKSRSRSPQMSPRRIHNSMTFRKTQSRSPTAPRSRSPFDNQYKLPYRSPRSRSPPRMVRYSPSHYPRPLSPLIRNTEVLNTITMAPLSPRSAAFVLQNRQIIARRQMSPRRSLSRDSSCRRSVSPKRSKLSPRRRSRSPRFESSRKCSLSPRRKSTSPRISPKRRSTSPRNHHRRSPGHNKLLPSTRVSVKRNSHSPMLKHPVHKRLGSRPTSRNVSPHYDYERKPENPQLNKRKRDSRSISLSLSPSPDRNYHRRPLNETTGHLDIEHKRPKDRDRRKDSPAHIRTNEPRLKIEEKSLDLVLEARKRKFELPMQIEKNGIIKLKTSKPEEQNEYKVDIEEMEQRDESDNEENYKLEDEEVDEIEDGILELNATIDDLWSDEESDNENEGRFKSKPSTQGTNVIVLPFRKLTEKNVSKVPLLPRDINDHSSERKRSKRSKNYSRKRSRSPLKINTNRSENKSSTKGRAGSSDSASHRERNSDKHAESKKVKVTSDKVRSKSLVEEKKEKIVLEVKDEHERKVEFAKTLSPEKTVPRKVKIQKVSEMNVVEKKEENDDEPEIILENETADVVLNKDEDGDLRAELSRRRAQRLIKAGSLAESLPARLLKSALQEVVPKRPTVKQSKISKGSGSSADRRVLILKRLTSSPAPQLEPANKVSNKEKKLPIHMRLGSTNATDVPLDEIVRSDRRKRSRSGRRKKAAVQV